MKKLFWLWIGILFIYLLFAGRGTFSFHTTQRNFFSLQAYSWLNGHLDLIVLPKDITDISFYNGKAYIYWPPLPTFFALPFVALFGVNVSDVFYTAFWASTPPILLYLILQKARKVKFIPQISDNTILLLTLFFAFGTVFFYLSVLGAVWFTSQAISMIPLLLSFYFLFRFVETKDKKEYLISIVFLCLAFWGRNTLILSLPLHLYIIFRSTKFERTKLFVSALSILAFNAFLFGYFNYIRFGNIFENGLGLHLENPRWINDLKNFGTINFHYLQHNFFYLFINPPGFIQKFPFIKPDPEGNSIFSTSPLFLLLLGIFSFKLWQNKYRTLSIFLVTSVFGVSALLMYFASGWFQFGYRYALDVIPLLILALAWVIKDYPKSFVMFLFLLSIIINTLGAIWMLQLAPILGY